MIQSQNNNSAAKLHPAGIKGFDGDDFEKIFIEYFLPLSDTVNPDSDLQQDLQRILFITGLRNCGCAGPGCCLIHL